MIRSGAKTGNGGPPHVLLVATPGGHLDLLESLRPSFERFDRTWVCSEGSSAEALRADGEHVITLPRFHGLSARNAALALRSVTPALSHRAPLVVTAGSGAVVPFCVAARLLGSRLLFIETTARVWNASDAGRVLSRLAAGVVVQWPEMSSVYRGARVTRPQLLDRSPIAELPAVEGRQGTFVTVGTHLDQFDRLLETADRALAAGLLSGPATFQTGHSDYHPFKGQSSAWLAPEEIDAAMHQAEIVVSHAGSGAIARALAAGHTPLVMWRRAAEGEHVDDHQEQLTRKLGELGLVVPIENEITEADIVRAKTQKRDLGSLLEPPPMPDILASELGRLGFTAA